MTCREATVRLHFLQFGFLNSFIMLMYSNIVDYYILVMAIRKCFLIV